MTQKQEFFTLMGGRVRIWRGRYNPTSDAVWLAAAAANTRAKSALDVGIGTGGAALCLAAHCPHTQITGIDISPEMLDECEKNAAANDVSLELILADITTWRTARTFDLVMTNPPYFRGTPARHNAHHNADLGLWTRKCVARTRPNGTFVTIVDAARVDTVIAAMHPTCGHIDIFPLFGARARAERVLISGRVGTHGDTILHRGMSMNTDAILRNGLTIADTLSTLG